MPSQSIFNNLQCYLVTDDPQRKPPRQAMHNRHSYHGGERKPPEPSEEEILGHRKEHELHFMEVLKDLMREVHKKQESLQKDLNEQRELFQDMKKKEEDTLKIFLESLSKQREDFQKQMSEERARFEDQCKRDREEHKVQMERMEQKLTENNNKGCFQQ